MKYIIDEEELKELLITLKVDSYKAGVVSQWFIKDKQPVEMIAGGEVVRDTHWDLWDIKNKKEFYNMSNILKDYQGKNIKIYIEE